MRGLFLFSTFVIIYGSLFPFNFQYVSWEDEGRNILFSTSLFGGRIADVLSNILLFIPFGFAGSELISRHKKNQNYYILLCLLAFTLALGVQILQIYIPRRFPAFYDAVWNMVGTFIGILAANIMDRRYPHILNSDNKISLFMLLISWIFFLLLPFIFTFEKELIIENINSYLDINQYKLANILIFSAIWIVFERLLDEMVYIRKNLLFSLESLLIITTILKIFAFQNVIEPEIFVGGIIAVIISRSTIYNYINPYKLASIILIPTMFYNSLYPFEFADSPSKKFVWLPFGELFSSNVLGTLRTLSYKIFVYGSIVWTLYRSYPNAKWIVWFLLIYATLIEYLQYLMLFRIGGLTEILIVTLLSIYLPKKSEKFDFYNDDDNGKG